MNRKVKPLVIVSAFWLALFFFIIAGYAGGLNFIGMDAVTGYAVATDQGATGFGLQSLAIVVLFFTNAVTLFFLVRSYMDK